MRSPVGTADIPAVAQSSLREAGRGVRQGDPSVTSVAELCGGWPQRPQRGTANSQAGFKTVPVDSVGCQPERIAGLLSMAPPGPVSGNVSTSWYGACNVSTTARAGIRHSGERRNPEERCLDSGLRRSDDRVNTACVTRHSGVRPLWCCRKSKNLVR